MDCRLLTFFEASKVTGEIQRMHVKVKGIVQGVGFRFFVYNAAQKLNLQGWVRNCINGDVEVLAEGPRHELETLLALINQGPPLAQVINVVTEWQEAKSDMPVFTVLPTDY